MQPALAFPFNDPDGTMFPHLQAILPALKQHFDCLYLCPPPATQQHTDHLRQLQADRFVTIFLEERELEIGERFASLYARAAQAAPVEQLLHLCFLDRLSFALEGEYRNPLLADIDSLSASDVPLIFQRSERAWETHPRNYRDIEGLVTTVGRHLFGRDLDYAWCHIVVRAGQLREILPLVNSGGLSMVAEMIFYLQDDIHTRDVDWLAWEDPFVLGREADELKRERETSLQETHKRLSYAVPMIETLTRLSRIKKEKWN